MHQHLRLPMSQPTPRLCQRHLQCQLNQLILAVFLVTTFSGAFPFRARVQAIRRYHLEHTCFRSIYGIFYVLLIIYLQPTDAGVHPTLMSHKLCGYSGEGRRNLVWNAAEGFYAYSSGHIVSLIHSGFYFLFYYYCYFDKDVFFYNACYLYRTGCDCHVGFSIQPASFGYPFRSMPSIPARYASIAAWSQARCFYSRAIHRCSISGSFGCLHCHAARSFGCFGSWG